MALSHPLICDIIEMFREDNIMKVVTFGEIMLRLKTPENLRIM